MTFFTTLEHLETIPFEEKAFYNEMILSKVNYNILQH